MQTIPAEQLQAFLSEARASGVYEMYYIELATGLRRGELLGLKWSDIDWKNGIIKVKRQIARVDGKVIEAPLKTKNSYRTVTISPQAVEVLKQQHAKTKDEFVFPSPNGGPILLTPVGLRPPSVRKTDIIRRNSFAFLQSHIIDK